VTRASLWANAPAAAELPAVADSVVVGGGPAGYTAAIYLARACASPVVLAGTAAGGQLMDTGVVENFPGFPGGIDGPELMARMREQAEYAGATVFTVDADVIRLGAGEAPVHEVSTALGTVRARSVVLATGASPRRLGLPGEAELGGGNGIAYCAVCEAPLFAGRDVAVVGGGDTAMEEALAVSKHARRVHLLHRREAFRCSPVMLERVRQRPNVEVHTDAVVTALHADPAGRLARLSVRRGTGTDDLAVQGLFVAIGHTPRSELVTDALPLTPSAHVHVTGPGGATPVPGLFVAGDVADERFRQAVTAAGAGCAAALECQRYLEENHVHGH
jgi:thioredoxin reductase (NADPH)